MNGFSLSLRYVSFSRKGLLKVLFFFFRSHFISVYMGRSNVCVWFTRPYSPFLGLEN